MQNLMPYSTIPKTITFYSKQDKHSYVFKKDSPQKAMLENFFDRSGTAPNASFYNGDRGYNLNMQTQKIAFLSQSPKAAVY
ncbi:MULTISPECIES: hypothetical protein [unclassified Bartonella]|uniref:hypothetical protein n=1 Tax=unclassified Bartonella TaxID=2645622 RepID=UPI0035CEEB86